MYLKKFKIGNLELENNLILAPMAGITDLPFRTVCAKKGNPGLVCNEMVSAKAIVYNDEKTLDMLKRNKEEIVSMQIFGSDADIMGQAARRISEIADIVDINFGCPAPKVVKNGDGSRLLLDLERIEEIIKEVVKNSNKPVTIKIRKGWDRENVVAVEVAKIAEKNGVSAVIVHGRTRDEYYTGHSDWNIIKKVKESINIPVIGNGDINSEEDALAMFEETECDGIMIGRGTLGNPWIFNRIKYYLENGEKLPPVSNDEKFSTIMEHFNLILKEKGEYTATREIRKHIAWYVKGMPNASIIRNRINQVETQEDFKKIITEYFSI